MEVSTVVLISFVGIAAICIAAFMILRDLFGGNPNRSRVASAADLRRARTVFDEDPADSATGRLDQAFDRLVLETGFEMTPTAAFLLILACGLTSGGLVFLYYDNEAVGLGGMLVGMALPLVAMMIYRARRLREIHEQLPLVLDLLARAVRAGQSLDQAVKFVGAETRGALGKEFENCGRQLDLGLSISNVMQTLSRRVRLMELRMLAATLMVHRQAGGNLPQALERMAAVVRDRLNYRRQMRASTGAGRTSTMLMAILGPLLFTILILWQPEHIQTLLDESQGQALLMTAIVLDVIGVIWVARVLKTDY